MGWNFELGFKGLVENKMYTEVALYSTQISNLLVDALANDQFIGINAGSSSHSGVEFVEL
jgi:iron complex outermembrane receptor protein